MMNELTFAYRRLGREQAALELIQKHLALYEKSLDGRDDVHLEALERVALGFSDMGRHEESVDLFRKALARRKEASNEEDGNILNLEYHLACGYSELGKHQAALKLLERTLKKVSRAFGDDDPITLETMVYATAYAYGNIGARKRDTVSHQSNRCRLKNRLRHRKVTFLQESSRIVAISERVTPKFIHESLLKSGNLPDTEQERISSKDKLRFWQKDRRRLGGPPS